MSVGAAESIDEDAELMRRIGSRDASAFRALYDRYATLVHTVAIRVLRDRHDAEELLEDVFWELWEKADRFDGSRGSVKAYLVMLARSRGIDRLRSRGGSSKTSPRMRAVSADASDLSLAATNDGDPSAPIQTSEAREAVVLALKSLDPQQREAIERSFYEGQSHSDIARACGRPLGTVKTQIRQGLLKLREALRSISG